MSAKRHSGLVRLRQSDVNRSLGFAERLEACCRSAAAPDFVGSRNNTDCARWYVVHCLAHQEFRAERHLLNQNYAVFLPRRASMRRHARRSEWVLLPYFPGYLFVSIDLAQQGWCSINGTRGVVRLVMRGDCPAPVPVGIVESLKAACDTHLTIKWQPELRSGQMIRVVAGPFRDWIGELDRLDGAGRVRVLLEIMGTHVPVALNRENIVPTGSIL